MSHHAPLYLLLLLRLYSSFLLRVAVLQSNDSLCARESSALARCALHLVRARHQLHLPLVARSPLFVRLLLLLLLLLRSERASCTNDRALPPLLLGFLLLLVVVFARLQSPSRFRRLCLASLHELHTKQTLLHFLC